MSMVQRKIDYDRSRRVMHRQLIKFGGGSGGFVIGADGARKPWVMARKDYTWKERGLYADNTSRLCLSALSTQTPPDFEVDVIEFKKMRYRIAQPIEGMMPDGSWVYFDAICTYLGRAD